jgi:hypothetical protein
MRSLPYRLFMLASICLVAQHTALADRVYIMNALGYNQADPELVQAIQSLGHTVDVSDEGAVALPANFTSTCIDLANGYDWLCFFGEIDHTDLAPDVQAFLNVGGKVLLQYEVSCCVSSSISAANILNAVTGLSVAPNANDYMAFSGTSNFPGWESASPESCVTINGNAFKCMDGLPLGTALTATANLNGSSPDISACSNFGFLFGPDDLPGNQGAILGLGDINLYYTSSGEPPHNGGTQPVDMDVISWIFPNASSTCAVLPAGCLSTGVRTTPVQLLGAVYPNPASSALTVELPEGHAQQMLVFNAQGACVMHVDVPRMDRVQLATEGLANGLYSLRITGAGQSQQTSFLVVH